MNENKENVKILSKDDVISLSNFTKRQKFLESYESWGVWLDISELNVQIFKAELPTGKVICVTRFKSYTTYGGNYASPVYRYGNSCEEYHACPDSWQLIAERLKDLKKTFLEEKKSENTKEKIQS